MFPAYLISHFIYYIKSTFSDYISITY